MAGANEPERWDWQHNHAKIRDAILQLWGEKSLENPDGLGRPPKVTEIAKLAGVSPAAVYRHNSHGYNPMESPVRALFDDVAMGITKSAIEGNAANAKLYMQLFHGFTEKSIVVTDPPKPLSDMTLEELDEYERSLDSEKKSRG